jgi:hypothetical protein
MSKTAEATSIFEIFILYGRDIVSSINYKGKLCISISSYKTKYATSDCWED